MTVQRPASPFVAQLAELCRAHRTRAKWILVPSHALGHTLGERLGLEGTGWANLRFATPLDLALPMAAPNLVERGIDPAPDGLGPALVMRLLLELPASVPVYFRRLAEHPKMAEALWAAIRELRLAGLSSADLRPEAFGTPAKHAELHALLTAYEQHLGAHRLADAADVYREALQHPDLCIVRPQDLWTELPGAIWSPLERALLDRLPAPRIAPRALRVPNLRHPRRLSGETAPCEPTPRTDADLLAYVMNPNEAPATAGDGSLAMFRAGGQEAEVEEVFRRVLEAGVPFDHVEVACASTDYATLVWEKAQRHDWPVTVGAGLPVTLTRPARGLLAFLEWVEAGFPASGLRRLLQSGDVRLDLADGPSAGQAARLLARSGATWGRETYSAAMASVASSYRELAADPDTDEEARTRHAERAAQAERLGTWITALVESIPPPGSDGRLTVGDLIAGCERFVREVASKQSETDGAAAAVLADALEDLRSVGDLSRSPRESVALLRHTLEALTVGADRARPGHLFVTTLRQAGYAGRPHTFVVGLEEGRVLPPLLEDAVLLDDERRALSALLPTSLDRASEALHAVVSRLAALGGGSVCLSFSCRDLREHRETFPSWLLLQALRVLRRRPDWTYQDLNRELGEPASLVPAAPARAVSDAGWWLSQANGLGPAALPSVHEHFPWLAQGEVAERARESEALTAYDGFVPAAGPRLDPRVTGRPISATALEALAGCPFRYFLSRGLGLEPIEESVPDRDRWLAPRTRGLLLHGLYAAILREIRDKGETVDPARHGARLHELAETRLAELRALIPPPSANVFARERQELLRDLDLFVRLRAAETGQTPVGFEVSFGGGPAEGEPLAQPDPVAIDLGPGVRFLLRGRIDRIDRLADGTYEVIDYKTGWYKPDDYAGTFRGGRLLQHALYALAATELLRRVDPKARVSRSAYYLPTVRGQAQRPAYAPQDGVRQVLADLLDMVAAGAFIHAERADDCRYCELGPACGRDSLVHARRKIACEDNEALAAYRRLGTHD